MINQAVILAGGKGVRLNPITLQTPKPMIRFHGKPFLEYIIYCLKENHITNIVILTGYLNEQIQNYFGDGSKFGISITYSYSPIDTHTGTRIKNAYNLFQEHFLLLYGDNYWPLNINKLVAFYKKTKKPALVTAYANYDGYSKNNIYINNDGIVEKYEKPAKSSYLNGVDIGFFLFEKKLLNNLPENNFSLEETVLPNLIRKKLLAGYHTEHKYYSLSTLDRIPLIKYYFTDKKIVFLDRDGVVNKKHAKGEYVTRWEQFHFLPDVKKALAMLTKKGYTIFIVTNQSGIARGKMSEKDLIEIHQNMKHELKKEGIHITNIYVCKHGWNDGCYCRKPNPGMLFQASYDYHFDLTKSIFIGDDERDLIAGQKADCKTFLVTEKRSFYDIVKLL